jgi:hypothetical protein
MPKSRSALGDNVLTFRHELMFTAEEIRDQYPDYDPAKGLDQYEGTDRDAGWVLRRRKINGDGEGIVRILTQSQRDVLARAAASTEEDAEPSESDDTDETNPQRDLEVSYQRAELLQMTVRWYGPYFTVSETYTVEDFTGSGDPDEAATIHPRAGRFMPYEPAWLNLLDEPVIDDATKALKAENQRRSPSEEAAFPAGNLSALSGNRPARRRRARGAT